MAPFCATIPAASRPYETAAAAEFQVVDREYWFMAEQGRAATGCSTLIPFNGADLLFVSFLLAAEMCKVAAAAAFAAFAALALLSFRLNLARRF